MLLFNLFSVGLWAAVSFTVSGIWKASISKYNREHGIGMPPIIPPAPIYPSDERPAEESRGENAGIEPEAVAEEIVACPCQNCGKHIEFNVSGLIPGMTVHCPHCGLPTSLFIPPESDNGIAATDTHR